MTLLLWMASGLALGADKVKVTAIPTGAGHTSAMHVTDFPVDAEGHRFGSEMLYHNRARPGLTVGNSKVSFATQWDLFTGYIFENTWDVPGDADARRRHQAGVFNAHNFKPRRLSVTANLPTAQIEAGLVTSHWGLGMMANDGDHEPWFGVNDFGDRVIRLRVTTGPGKDSPVTITGAYDQVVEDDLARWTDGQSASQVVGAIVYKKAKVNAAGDDRVLGLYGVVRDQREILAQRQTEARVLDLYGTTPLDLGGAGRLVVSAEVAGIDGRTNRATTYNSTESVQVRSAGATGVVTYGTNDKRYTAHLRGGWASGDSDPSDGVSSDFRFDRDFGVGQVLFDEYLGAIDAAAHHTLSDPQYAGRPPDGLDATVSEGAFQTASFVQPIVEGQLYQWLHARAGAAMSWSTKPISQRFYTHRAGGTPMNHHNKPTSGYFLGTEVDWTLTLADSEEPHSLLIAVSGGHLFLGDDLKGSGPDQIDLYRVLLGNRW